MDLIARRKIRLAAFALIAAAGIAAFFLVSGFGAAGSHGEASTLEEGGNLNLALQQAQNGRGPSIVGDPAAVYGRILTYSAAAKAAGSSRRDGESQAWKFDRPVYLYLFEGDIADADPRTSQVTDWAQVILIFDAETGSSFRGVAHRAITAVDVSQFLPLTISDSIKGVPSHEIKSLNRPPPVLVASATPRRATHNHNNLLGRHRTWPLKEWVRASRTGGPNPEVELH